MTNSGTPGAPCLSSPVEDVALARVTLSELMARLNKRQRSFLTLRLQGYSTGEIALVMASPQTQPAGCCSASGGRHAGLEEDGRATSAEAAAVEEAGWIGPARVTADRRHAHWRKPAAALRRLEKPETPAGSYFA